MTTPFPGQVPCDSESGEPIQDGQQYWLVVILGKENREVLHYVDYANVLEAIKKGDEINEVGIMRFIQGQKLGRH